MSVFGGPAWTYREERGQFYLHQFLDAQPDLNYRNPAILEEMKGVISFWLELGVDGFRMDAVSGHCLKYHCLLHMTFAILHRFSIQSRMISSEMNLLVETQTIQTLMATLITFTRPTCQKPGKSWANSMV